MIDPSQLRPTPICVETSIGTLALFPQRFKDIGPFSKLPSDDPPSRRLRLYLACIASRADAPLRGGEQSRLDEDSRRQLSDDDLERIAEAYLSMPDVRMIAETDSPRARPIARMPDEAASAYLDRLLTADHERQMEDINGTYESFRKRYGLPLSIALADLDRQASSLRATASTFTQAQDLTEGIRQASQSIANAAPGATEGGGQQSLKDLATGSLHEDDRFCKSAQIVDAADIEIAERQRGGETSLTRSIGTMATQSAILLASLSESATQFLRQFSETTRKSDEGIRKSLRIAAVGIFVSAVFSAIAVVVTLKSYLQNRDIHQTADERQAAILQTVKETAATQENALKSLAEKIRELDARQSALVAVPALAATEAVQDKGASASAAKTHRDTAKPAPAKRGSKRKDSR